MQTGRASRTAMGAAWYRAEHQELESGRVFSDPLAAAIVGARPADVADVPDERARRRLRLFIAARARFAEDSLAGAVAAGVRQVVVLGAGLDTFAYRNPYKDVRVFEVDHPATQAWKRDRLREAGIEIPESMTFAPVDFEHDALEEAMAAAGFDRNRPAFFGWLGVTIYLTEQAIDSTLRYIASIASPTSVVFDYSDRTNAATPAEAAAAAARQERLAAIGERWITYFTAADVDARLRAHGFTDIEDLDPNAIRAKYFGGPPGLPRIPGGHIVRATQTTQ